MKANKDEIYLNTSLMILSMGYEKHQYNTYKDGHKTVCVGACLAYFKILPNQYKYNTSVRNPYHYKSILRLWGYSVKSLNSKLGIKKLNKYNSREWLTLTKLRKRIKSEFTSEDRFIVHVGSGKGGHVIILDGNGQTIIDTAENSRWHVQDVVKVEKN